MVPNLQKQMYCLGCHKALSSGPYFSWPLLMTCQSPQITQMPDCLLTTAFSVDKSSQDQALLQEDLSALERWEETWQMKFHPDKCTVIRISTNKKQILKTNYHIQGHTLEVVDSIKCLGVTISEDLTWKRHIDNTVNKANKTLGFIGLNLGDCTAPVKAGAYSTTVRHVLECSSTVWDPHQNSDIHNLEQVPRRAARIVHRNYTERAPGYVTSMVQSLRWESLQHRRYTDRLSMLLRIQHGLVDVTTDYIQPNDTRTRGSQRLLQLQSK